MLALSALLALLPLVFAAQAPVFAPPSTSPTAPSGNYTGASNSTLPKPKIVPGAAFDRFIQIWLENTDFADAISSSTFAALAKEGIFLNRYYAVTHPSEPNYLACSGGDFFGLGDDNFYHIPSNISTIVDLLEAKNISWAGYQENMPTDGFGGFSYASPNYLNSSAPPYTYYVRKHNPLIIYDSVANVSSRASLNRNFNDFAADVTNGTIPQWVFVTPNLVNDAHDTTVDFVSQWLQYWLIPLLNNTNFNDNRTLILLTFDENENYGVNNQVYSALLGGAIPAHLRGTNDSVYFTHYSSLSTVEANWKLDSLGRGDTNKTMSNVFSFVANTTGYKNLDISDADIPLTNLTTTIPGPLNPDFYVPFVAPNISAIGAGGGPVFVAPGLNTSFTATVAPAPVNLTALNLTVPAELTIPSSSSSPSSSPPKNGAKTRLATTNAIIGASLTMCIGVAVVMV